MPERKTQVITFAIGSGLVAAGLVNAPASEIFLTVGSALTSLAYSILFLSWRRGALGSQAQPGGVAAPQSSTPSSTGRPLSTTAPSEPVTPGIPAPSTPAGPPASEAQSPPFAPSPPSSTVETAGPLGTPPPAPSPPVEKPSPPGRKLPSLKAPRVSFPKPIMEHRVPILLVAIGLPLIAAGLLALGQPLSVVLGLGLLVPGILLLGVGGVVLFLQLYRRPVGLRRFCMHCGFQMMTTDISCGRCHRSPPSGVDTKVCPNCTAVIPALAKFCRDCGAGQPAS